MFSNSYNNWKEPRQGKIFTILNSNSLSYIYVHMVVQVKEFVQLTNVYYAGSHGMDIMVPSNKPKHCNGKYSTISSDKEVSCSSKCKLVSVVQLL